MTALAASGTEAAAEPGRDPPRPVTERVADLLGRMTLAEKLAQLGSVWVGAADDGATGSRRCSMSSAPSCRRSTT
ncbi:MAG TPA: hypothetical protein VN767_05415 [Streptosporangiaceae bacterium]|jgi:hypothetical protein|nr:hypothetical protein [Streptosporangiaceae bacterium]